MVFLFSLSSTHLWMNPWPLGWGVSSYPFFRCRSKLYLRTLAQTKERLFQKCKIIWSEILAVEFSEKKFSMLKNNFLKEIFL